MGRCQGGYCEPLVLEIISKEKNIHFQSVKKNASRTELLYGCTKTLSEKKSPTLKTSLSRTDPETEALLQKRAKQVLAASLTERKDVGEDG
jgi:hypothetical protein